MPEALRLGGAWATIGGEAWIAGGPAAGRPLVVALHGGGFGRGYFTGPHPLAAAAAAHGADTVLLDRPGAGDSAFHRRDGDILTDNAAALDEAVSLLWQRYGAGRPGVFLIGHSIGGAIALMMAAGRPAWPLIGVSASGIAERAPPQLPFPDLGTSGATQPLLPRAALAHVMMTPETASDAALNALEAASLPALSEELGSIYPVWTASLERVLRAVERPVQIIVAGRDPLWIVDEAAVDRLRKLVGAPGEVTRWPDAGHCIDYDPAAPRFHEAVFGFMHAHKRRVGGG